MIHRQNHYVVMFVIMIFSGLLSTMNVWADKLSDIRLSLNDLYMVLLMAGWMLVFMAIFYSDTTPLIVGLTITGLALLCIRKQFMISEKQFINGMIPHHSMAVHMSRRLLSKGAPQLGEFASGIIDQQEKEIEFMKGVERA